MHKSTKTKVSIFQESPVVTTSLCHLHACTFGLTHNHPGLPLLHSWPGGDHQIPREVQGHCSYQHHKHSKNTAQEQSQRYHFHCEQCQPSTCLRHWVHRNPAWHRVPQTHSNTEPALHEIQHKHLRNEKGRGTEAKYYPKHLWNLLLVFYLYHQIPLSDGHQLRPHNKHLRVGWGKLMQEKQVALQSSFT